MDTVIIDQATATAALQNARRKLSAAITYADAAMSELRNAIIMIRPSGVLTVEQMAEAIGKDRNYVDSVWSNFGSTQQDPETGRVRQTRVPTGHADAAAVAGAKKMLKDAERFQHTSAGKIDTARAERDRVVALVYASKLLGPSAIAVEVEVDRNHVLRIARRAGVAPVHRQGSRNQYSV